MPCKDYIPIPRRKKDGLFIKFLQEIQPLNSDE